MKEKFENNCPVNHEMCSVIHALDIIGGKWRIPIVWHISVAKTIRYNELKRRVNGITNIMLTRSLLSLEEHGLVKRIEYNKIPPHVEYSLTEFCEELLPALKIINEWGKRIPETCNKSNSNVDTNIDK